MSKFTCYSLTLLFVLSSITAQDKGEVVDEDFGFYKTILETLDGKFKKEPKKVFKADLPKFECPSSIDEFTYYWHREPHSQGRTGTCWSFSTTSFLESEVYRINKKKVELSEIHTAYWEYVEKAKDFVKTRGETFLGQGSEANAVLRIWKKYGVVPDSVYSGLKEGQKFHDHKKMFDEIKSFLLGIKERNEWNETSVVETIKSIMDFYIGTPPSNFVVKGKEYTPKTYLAEYLKLNMDDYVDIISYKQHPYWEQVPYDVPDNWWFNSDYHNVPLDDFMKALKNAIRNDYTISIGGDVSESGKLPENDLFYIPTFDIPADFIDENSRQFRFSNKTTTDDHGVHLIGFVEKDGEDWFLIKDSGSSSFTGKNKGYYFFHEDYIKLKIMDFMVHKDAVKDLLEKFD
ncbi:MAG: C1 family peptidase [Ignavibacteria bacterium]|jgi:bleomycin hydrolase